MRSLLPVASERVDLEAAYAVPPETPFHVRASFISSADGAVTLDGRSGGLGNAADKEIFGLARDLADVILVGAGTARAEAYGASRPIGRRLERRRRHGLPDAPVMALVSESLQFDLGSDLFPTDEPRTVIYTSDASPRLRRARLERHADVVVVGMSDVDLRTVVADLRHRDLRRVHCEGGPRLFAGLVSAGLVDELCLTYAPLLTGPKAGRIVTGQGWGNAVRASMQHLLEDEGYLYARYQLQSSERRRSKYERPLRTLPEMEPHPNVRPVTSTDDARLGGLMERAYRGTVDEDLGDNDDGAVEIADWRASGAVAAASFVAVDNENEPVSASLVSRDRNGSLWIGYVITDPAVQGQGLATAVVAASLTALRADNPEGHVYAAVTDGNTPSERLLARMGFRWLGAL